MTGERRSTLGLLCVPVLVSGAAGLMVEVVFTRRLVQILGSTSDAVATVLASFMAGFALGAAIWGRRADRIDRPVRLYAMLEILIGASSIGIFLGLPLLEPAFSALYAASGRGGAFAAARFATLFLLLLVPTAGMGATLPVLARAVARSGLGRGVGVLYAVNTAGAVLGTLGAGFVLVEALGLTRTVLVAATGNAVAAILAVVLLRDRAESAESPAEEAVEPSPLRRVAIASTFVSGFAALGLEVVWTRILILYITGTTYAFSVMLATFLVGIAAGSWLWSRRLDRDPRPAATLAATLALAAYASLFAVAILLAFPQGRVYPRPEGPTWLEITARHAGESFAVMLLPTLCLGGAFPVACRLAHRGGRRVGRDVGAVYVGNTVGAILGSLVTGFVLIPTLGLHGSSLCLASLLMAWAVALGATHAPPGRSRAAFGLAVVAFVATAALLGVRSTLLQVGADEDVVFYREGRAATVAVVERRGWERRLLIDNIFVAGSHPVMLTDQKSLAHFPCLLHPDPRRVLSVGFGSGGASYSFSLYREVERVECVEIVPEVLEAARFFPGVNHDILSHPKMRVILDDGRSYLSLAPASVTYDVIVSDCTDISYRANADLYQRELFAACRRRLNPGGIMCVWLPLRHLSRADFATALASFQDVFPEGTLWYMLNLPSHYVLLMGTDGPLTVDLERVRDRMARPEIRDDLAEVGLTEPLRMASCFLLDGPGMARLTAGARRHTEDRPVLEFTVPRYDRGVEREYENLEEMLPLRIPLDGVLPDLAARHPSTVARGDLVARALTEGHVHLLRAAELRALRSYVLAYLADPGAVDVNAMLSSRRPRLEGWARKADAKPRHLVERAHLALLEGRIPDAERDYESAIRHGEDPAACHLALAACARASGRSARERLLACLAASPADLVRDIARFQLASLPAEGVP